MSGRLPRQPEEAGDRFAAASEAAQRWAQFDPDPVTRGQIDRMVDGRDPALVALFEGRIAFGTAGLRAEVGPGPNHMNALVVRQTTTGVVEWLQHEMGCAAPRIVVGFDARHDSARFALHVAAAVVGAGGFPLLAEAAAPTPVFARAVLDEHADAGVVITASHNPAADNGYKLYLGDGLQLVDPADVQIAALIDELAASWFEAGLRIDEAYAARGDEFVVPVESWLGAHRRHAVAALFTNARDVRVAYTAMHGVGGLPIVAAFREAGFADPLIVEEQFEPDPGFPTVPFPNPEEPGALDQVIALAESEGADAAFANDPDADRLAIAVPGPSDGSMVALSGNELGVLLADYVLRNTTGTDRIVARSVVSSRQLDAVAEAHGVQCEVTLTGFKWVARPIVDHPDKRFVFGYEEAIGYCIGDRVRDKDGVTAAVVAAEMLASLRADGLTVWDRLDALAADHGIYLSQPLTVRFDDEPASVGELMKTVEDSPPDSLAGEAIVAAGPVGLGSLPPTSGLHLLGEADTQVIVRPSGTEPKIKAYIEVLEPMAAGGDVAGGDVAGGRVAAARARAQLRLEAIAAEVAALLGSQTER